MTHREYSELHHPCTAGCQSAYSDLAWHTAQPCPGTASCNEFSSCGIATSQHVSAWWGGAVLHSLLIQALPYVPTPAS
jgi:hypothetical protein